MEPDESLHEFVDLEFDVPGTDNPARQAELAEVLQKFRGLKKLSLAAGKVAVTYEPINVTRAELIDAIRGAGFQVEHVEASTSSPVSDAFEKIVLEPHRTGETSDQHAGSGEK
ncbi:MAG TPA: heavy metal-associated domain-containing protein [Chthoniobacteraceae bacterium]|nr:heavy metal-associated domain-containing protein [Chthoniobacteraceae bacterium]